ncbi:MAG: hypothetical protein KatS3mg105_2310 [Gemmatales bacterium]|nr:MAG: hypothetical protein KatS3mg105_2310 [Gemmatales bacterium]
MRSIFLGLATMIVGGLVATAVEAGYPFPPVSPYQLPPPIRHAPDACGPGFYITNQCGMVYGPNYHILPPFPPYNGERPCWKGCHGPALPTHPFARGPRDFFMID